MTHRPTQLINDEGVCRTPPATPGLLKMVILYTVSSPKNKKLVAFPIKSIYCGLAFSKQTLWKTLINASLQPNICGLLLNRVSPTP